MDRGAWHGVARNRHDLVPKPQLPTEYVMAFLSRNNYHLTSWLQSWSAVIFQPKKMKYVTVSNFSLPICHEVLGLDVMILDFLNVEF